MKRSAHAGIAMLLAFLLFTIGASAQNPIVTENALPGNPSSEWDVTGAGDLNTQGFATQISVNKGQTINFKIKSPFAYTVDIYRLGWYNGNGARKVSTTNPVIFDASLPQSQPADLYDAVTGKVSCTNWALSAHWNVPATAVSGIYIAKLTNTGGGSSHIAFVVRDDNSASDILVKTSDATWQAYNAYGGSSLYVGTTAGVPNGHATKVSYDRPFITRGGGGGGGVAEDWIFNAEYPMIRWMERNGYNLSYTTDVDMDKDPVGITPTGAGSTYAHKIFLSVGHDEYWSLNERTKVENARNAGVHIAFFSGNEVYWKTRWEDNNRTLVCYKEGTLGENVCGGKCDPTSTWTGLWRDGSPSTYPGSDGGKPENALSGQISWALGETAITVPSTFRNMRFWRNSTVASLPSGQTATLTSNTIGYEYDFENATYINSYPKGRVTLSSTLFQGNTHKLSLYKHSSGAIVFGAGTIQWSWGLDDKHDRGTAAASVAMQQATLNLFADMGVQPATKQSTLVAATASTDFTAPTVTITSPANNTQVAYNSIVVVSGTSTDQNVVAGIEYSTDGGNTWQVATGNTSWSFSFTATVAGTNIIKVRGFDDSGNLPPAGSEASITISVGTAPPPDIVVPDEGNGGPVLLVTSTSNPFSKFPIEILRAEGWNAYKSLDISVLTASELNKYDVVLIGDIAVSATQASLFSNWVTNNGGTLVAFSPDPTLHSLMGITAASGTLKDRYIKINNSTPAGSGLVNATIQFHGTADYFTVNSGTSVIATLYSDANTATTFPAVTQRVVGTNGGQAIAFTYDLARSIVYTRQGNPAWSGQERDGQAPIRSDDLFFGASATDPQSDYVDLNKVDIPQADEQMRLLSNLMLIGNYDKKPLPRIWFLPKGKKAAVVMTGDDHGNGGTKGRFDQYKTLGPNTPEDVANWNAIRGTSYIYPSTPITDADIAQFQNDGFEISLHLNTNCADFTESSWNSFWDAQWGSLKSAFPSINNPITHRTHCIAFGAWATTPKLELQKGVRLDANYYYWPGSWIANRPGMFTGSGMPMRFADLDGSLINCYQVTTQMTDESEQIFPFTIDALLDAATGAKGYYGIFCANMHTDFTNVGNAAQDGSDAIVSSAISRQIPVVSAKQMLDWIDGRNNSYFTNIAWANNQLSFTLVAGSKARNMKAMLPVNTGYALLQSITSNGASIPFTTEIIKGINYAFFDGTSSNYVASYSAITPDVTPPVISNILVNTDVSGNATVTWTTDDLSDSRIDFGTSAASLNLNSADATLTTNHTIKLTGLTSLTTYYFRVTSNNAFGYSATSPLEPAVPAQFTVPLNTICAADDLASDFLLGNTGANITVATNGNGELSLKQVVIEENFTSTTIPQGYTSAVWTTGGSTVFNGSAAIVNGAEIYSSATYLPGTTMEFSAKFTLGDYENIGFAQNGNFDPFWITIGRGAFGTSTSVSVRTSDNITVVLGNNLLDAYHTYKIVWSASNFTIYVDGVLAATITKTYTSPLIFAASDYFADGTAVSLDYIRNITGAYPTSGTYLSRIFSLGSYSGSTNVSWNESIPANTGLTVSVRSGNTATPDASWTAFTQITNGQSVTPAGSFIQYQATLTTSNSSSTPLLNDIKFDCVNTQTQLPPVISNVQAAPSLNGTSVITWTTDVASDSRIDFGTSVSTLSNAVNDATLVTSHSITLTGLTLGATYYYTVTSKYGTTLSTTFPAAPAAPLQFTVPVIPPPVISAVQAVPSVNGTSVVTWTTDVTSDSRVDYGTSPASLSSTVNDAAQVTSHSITLTGLTLGTTYYYTVTSRNGASLPATFPAAPASPLQFTMPAIAPAVTLQPSNAVTCVNGVITMTSAATGTPSPTVQWQASIDGTIWTNITGATNSTLSFTPVLTDNSKRYRASWTNAGGTANSTVALLTVNPLPAGTLTSGIACYGQPAQLTFTSTAGTGPYSLVVNGVTYNNVVSGTRFTTTTTPTAPATSQIQLWANSVVPGSPNYRESSAIEVGTKVRVTTAGTVTALRFYKGNRKDGATYRLRLYNNATRRIMAQVTYSNPNFVGWVSVNLPTPVALSPDSLYVVTYYSPNRYIARQNNVFTNDVTSTPLIGVGTSTIYGPNGVYVYGGGFPTATVAGRGYFADLVFNFTPAPTPIAFTLTRITDANGCAQTVNQVLNVTPDNCTAPALGKSTVIESTMANPLMAITDGFALEQNRPNPFNNTTTISYTIPKQVRVTLTVYDLNGRIIRVIDEGQRKAGKYMLNIDSRNMTKGIYMYRLQAGEFTATKKMILE